MPIRAATEVAGLELAAGMARQEAGVAPAALAGAAALCLRAT